MSPKAEAGAKSAAETPERRALSAVLRGLRQDAQLSTPALAERLGWSQSRVSRVDRGLTMPTLDDAVAWCDQTSADAATRRTIEELVDRGRVQLTEWIHEVATGRRRKQAELADLERAASVIRVFGADVVPGLGQTPPYAGAMFELGRAGVTDEVENVDEVVAARIERQAVMDKGQRIELLCTEYALNRHFITGAEMREQVDRLIGLLDHPHVHLGVIPFYGKEKVHQYGGYAILGDPGRDAAAVVLVETLTRGLTLHGADDLARYVEHFAALDAAALHGADLRSFLTEVRQRCTW